jgi:hypothetical protein
MLEVLEGSRKSPLENLQNPTSALVSKQCLLQDVSTHVYHNFYRLSQRVYDMFFVLKILLSALSTLLLCEAQQLPE